MNDLLQRRILDNTIQSYLYVIAVLLVVLIVKRFISRYLANLVCRLALKAKPTLNREALLELVIQPLEVFLLLFVSLIALDKLNFPGVWKVRFYKITLHDVFDSISSALMIIVFIWLLLRIIDFIALILEEKANHTPDQTDNQLIVFFKDFFKVIFFIIGILLLLRFSFHQDVSNLLTGLSIVGAAIALATRESMENLIASFIIFFDRPFSTGDVVKVEGFTGTVERIGLRSTRVRTDQKTYITIPNKKMVDSILDNITMRTQRKVEAKLELSLSTTASQLQQLIPQLKGIVQKEGVEDSTVYLSETGRQSYIVEIDYFTTTLQSMKDFIELQQNINLEITGLLESSGIQLAAKQTNVVVESKPI